MKRLLPYLAFACLSLSGCSKKDDPQATATPAAPSGVSYSLNNRATTATGQSIISPNGTAGASVGQDTYKLFVTYKASAATQAEYVQVYFSKAPGAADNTYKLSSIHVDGATSATTGDYNSASAATLAKTASGKWSGTFSGTKVSASGVVVSTLASGVFTEIAP